MKNKFLTTIKEFNLLKPGDTVLIAVSGGADSLALLHLLNEHKDQLGISLHVAHLNHMLRKGDAEIDMRYVQAAAQSLGLPAIVEAVDVAEFARSKKLGIEAAARQVRYGFLERAAAQAKANKIAVGHTADDNVETFLMRLLRGAGIKGLCGIPPKRANIVRPLIKIWRREIEDYVGSLKLVPRRDHTNYESKYMRNRVRMKLIPQLKLYNLNIKEIILQTVLLLTEDKVYIETKAAAFLDKAIVSVSDTDLVLKVSKIMEAEEQIKGHIIRQAIERVKGDLIDLSYAHIQDIVTKLEATERFQLHLPDELFVLGGQGTITFSRNKPVIVERKSYRYNLSIPGEVFVKELGKTLKASLAKKTEVDDNSQTAFLDQDFLAKNLVVREWQDGDKFTPLGMRGSKKVQDFFVDEKIPLEQRDLIPLVLSGKDVVWVAGLRIDERAKVKRDSKKIIKLEIK